jgi:tRNA(Arg) A34 adenosine deaminase TadA
MEPEGMSAADPVEAFLREAIGLSREARVAGNHPFGALLVLDGAVVPTAQNACAMCVGKM